MGTSLRPVAAQDTLHCHCVHFSSELNRVLGRVPFPALFTGPWDFSFSVWYCEGNRLTSAISVVRSYGPRRVT